MAVLDEQLGLSMSVFQEKQVPSFPGKRASIDPKKLPSQVIEKKKEEEESNAAGRGERVE